MSGSIPPVPAPGTPRAYRFPRVDRRVLSAGTRVVAAPVARVPLVTLAAVFHAAGADRDPAGREGLAQLVASMLREGTTSRDGAAVAELFESLGSSLSAIADWDATTVSFTVQTARLDAAVAALCEVLHAPAFSGRELARLQAEHRADRLQVAADASGLADAALAWSCYGDRSRYRRPIDGTIASVATITRDDLVSFWRARYSTRSLTVVLAGDVSADRAAAVANSLAAGLASETAISVDVAVEPRYPGRNVTLVEKPEAAQAELRLGHVGVPRSHASYFPLMVMNAVLGGLFSSRINLNLRERHGYTYGAFSGFDWRRCAGPWSVSTAVKTETCDDAVREVLAEIDRIRSTAIAREELELATNYLIGVFPLRFETTAAVASALASQTTFQLPDDYFDTYRDRVAGVSTSEVTKVAAEHLDPRQLQIVAAGDPALLRAELSAIDGGELLARTPEDVEAAP
jgi:zinc protease